MKRISIRAAAVCAALCLCLLPGTAAADENTKISGVASWFGHWHHGKNTASGEPFDMYAMTAAHRTLPFGTVLKVTNRGNGREVIVRVNDRGPYRKRRILDLSYAAADRLGMRVSGTANIIMEVVGDVQGRPLGEAQAFFVSLEGPRKASAQADPSPAVVRRRMSQLLKVGVQEAPSLLHTAEGVVALGPFDTFQEAQEALNRVATTCPAASIMLADRASADPASSSVAASDPGAEPSEAEEAL